MAKKISTKTESQETQKPKRVRKQLDIPDDLAEMIDEMAWMSKLKSKRKVFDQILRPHIELEFKKWEEKLGIKR